jgi:hypothetical protein
MSTDHDRRTDAVDKSPVRPYDHLFNEIFHPVFLITSVCGPRPFQWTLDVTCVIRTAGEIGVSGEHQEIPPLRYGDSGNLNGNCRHPHPTFDGKAYWLTCNGHDDLLLLSFKLVLIERSA